MSERKVSKILSKNDTGETHSHQSGISIPKDVVKKGILPELGTDRLNPRTVLAFIDPEGLRWEFQYIYYNDAFFGKEPAKSHNEYRLTCVLEFLRHYNAQSGDTIWFSLTDDNVRHIGIDSKQIVDCGNRKVTKIVLGRGWHYFEFGDDEEEKE